MQEHAQQKTPALPAVRSLADIGRYHGRLAGHVRAIVRIQDHVGQKICELQEKAGVQVALHQHALTSLAHRIFEYAMLHQDELLQGAEKRVHLRQGGFLEWRKTPPALTYTVEEQQAVKVLEEHGLTDCINYSPTVNKTALKARLEGNPSLLVKLRIFSLASTNLFRIQFTGLKQRVECDIRTEEWSITVPRTKDRSTL